MKKSWKKIPEGGIITEPGSSVQIKTGSWKTEMPVFDAKKCINCMRCHFYCPEGAIKVENGRVVGIDYEHCKGCGICAEECPVKALVMKKVSEDGKD